MKPGSSCGICIVLENSIPGDIIAEQIRPKSEYSVSKDNVCYRKQGCKNIGMECIKAVAIGLDSVRQSRMQKALVIHKYQCLEAQRNLGYCLYYLKTISSHTHKK